MTKKADYQPMQPHAWTATGMRPSSSSFGPSLWVRESEAREAIAAARTAARDMCLKASAAFESQADKARQLNRDETARECVTSGKACRMLAEAILADLDAYLKPQRVQSSKENNDG
jgi:hypothetical protein